MNERIENNGGEPMRSVHGIINAVQEGRFRLMADDGRFMPFVLHHRAGTEPQDLLLLHRAKARIRVDYADSPHLIAAVAERIEIEE